MNPAREPPDRAGREPAQPSVPECPDAGPTVASPNDLGVERENNRERLITEPFRQRTECARGSGLLDRALRLEIEPVAARGFHDGNGEHASVFSDDELHVGAQRLLLTRIEPKRDLRDDVVKVRGVRKLLSLRTHVRDIGALPALFAATSPGGRRVESRALRVRHLRGSRWRTLSL